MEIFTAMKSQRNSIETDPFFEQDVYKNNSFINLYSNFESKNQLNDVEKMEKIIFSKKMFEKANINEIFDLLKVMNQPDTINVNKADKKDYYYSNKQKRSHSIENKKIISDDEDEHSKECKEILQILQTPLNDKNDDEMPFKSHLKPTKISLVGKVIVAQNSFPENNNENGNNSNICL